mmetsp:Transcript_14761/g.31853  ORF Transcript_14761/g.31853 Transcript_14761/m.31853 type:complete len:156 (-) Transcript_14761:838-1305(-)
MKMIKSVHYKYSKANIVNGTVKEDATTVHTNDDYSIGSSTTVTVAEASTSTPFDYIGDIDPTKPLPWPKEEEDWWNFHDLLVQRVKASIHFLLLLQYTCHMVKMGKIRTEKMQQHQQVTCRNSSSLETVLPRDGTEHPSATLPAPSECGHPTNPH